MKKNTVFTVMALFVFLFAMSANAANITVGPISAQMGADVALTSPRSAGLHEQYAGIGNNVNLYVSATGAGLTYQWRKDAAIIAGATDSGLTLADVVVADSGSYDCVISGICGAPATLAAVTVVIIDPLAGTPSAPTFSCPFDTITNTVTITGGKAPYFYAWSADYGAGAVVLANGASPGGGTIAGVATDILTITNAGLLDAADYSCDVSDTPLVNDPDL